MYPVWWRCSSSKYVRYDIEKAPCHRREWLARLYTGLLIRNTSRDHGGFETESSGLAQPYADSRDGSDLSRQPDLPHHHPARRERATADRRHDGGGQGQIGPGLAHADTSASPSCWRMRVRAPCDQRPSRCVQQEWHRGCRYAEYPHSDIARGSMTVSRFIDHCSRNRF